MIFKSKNIEYIIESYNNRQVWVNYRSYHRPDRPAIICNNGYNAWYEKGLYIKSVWT